MTKEELKQEAEEWLNKWELCNKCENKVDCISNFSYCKKVVLQSYLASAEPREKRIEELIALINAERERQEKCDDVHLRTIADLEKENAELKADNTEWERASDRWKSVYELTNNQLTNAKEIIKGLLSFVDSLGNYSGGIFAKAEQFLKGE